MRLFGHSFAVRRLRCSPHSSSTILSCGYDMNICLWNIQKPDDNLIQRYDHHTEFVFGIDFDLFNEGRVSFSPSPSY